MGRRGCCLMYTIHIQLDVEGGVSAHYNDQNSHRRDYGVSDAGSKTRWKENVARVGNKRRSRGTCAGVLEIVYRLRLIVGRIVYAQLQVKPLKVAIVQGC